MTTECLDVTDYPGCWGLRAPGERSRPAGPGALELAAYPAVDGRRSCTIGTSAELGLRALELQYLCPVGGSRKENLGVAWGEGNSSSNLATRTEQVPAESVCRDGKSGAARILPLPKETRPGQ